MSRAETEENSGPGNHLYSSQYLKKQLWSYAGAILLVAGAFSAAHGQGLPGTNDPGFNTADVIPNAEGFNGAIRSIVLQPDGKMITGGNFSFYNGIPYKSIIRLQADGTPDNSFDSGTGFDSGIVSMALQPDGKIIVAGNFTSYNGIVRNKIARLLPDGSLDNAFNTGIGFGYGNINCMILQPDGKIVVGGDFNSYNGTARSRLARLLADGSLDTSFDPGNTFTTPVLSIALQPDGRIMVGTEFASTAINSRIIRLLANGSLDGSFNPGTGPNGPVRSIVLQQDGKIVAGGEFSSYNSTTRNRIARLHANGSLDESFNPGTAIYGAFRSIALQPDGKIIAGGGFATYQGLGQRMLIRLHTDGSLDDEFEPGHGSFVLSIALQADGTIMAGGDFVSYNGTPRSRITRLSANGSPDNSFYSGAAYNGFNGTVHTMAIGSDSKTVVGGSFTSFNGTAHNRIARLLPDGSLDNNFIPGTGFNGAINSIALQPDGKMVVGGDFTTYNGTPRNRIARLHADGSLDNTFNPGNGFSGTVNAIVLQPDGKIVVGGNFVSYNSAPRNNIVRLNADGSLDNTFFSGNGFDSIVLCIVLQPDGKIVVGGSYTSYSGTARNRIARLHTDGALDSSFNPGTGFSNYVRSIVLQPDGKLIAGGFFTSYNGTDRKNIARLHADGTLDDTFNSGSGSNFAVGPIVLQPDGKIIAGGSFTSYNTTDRNYIARLHTDGSLDNTFNPGTGFNNWVQTIALQTDGNVVAGGNFTSFDGIPRNRIARLFGGEGASLSAPKEQQEGLEVLVYPNPTSGDLNLASDGLKASARAVEVVLHNNIGQPVLQQVLRPEQVQTGVKLSTAHLAAGVYYLKVRWDGRTISRQVVLQR